MLVDIGANLTHDAFDIDRHDVLERARAKGVSQIVVTGASAISSAQALALCERSSGLFCTIGVHPHHAEETDASLIDTFRGYTTHPLVKAIGETGLDFFRDLSPRAIQQSSFEQHMQLAKDVALPMFLHERDAFPTLSDMLAPRRSDLSDVVIHCFTGEQAALYRYLDLDCHIGITGWVCDERRGSHLIDLIPAIPLNRIMLETDAPYLLPRTVRPKPKSRRNEPHHLTTICDFVATILKLRPEELAAHTTRNAQRFFQLPEATP